MLRALLGAGAITAGYLTNHTYWSVAAYAIGALTLIDVLCDRLHIDPLGDLLRAAGTHLGIDMPKVDAAHWHAAVTNRDLGELTALWIERRIGSQPGYRPNVGLDDESAPFANVLAAVNRAGLRTISSNAGSDDYDYTGRRWQQRAAVEGYADDDTKQALLAALTDTDLIILVRRPRLRRWFCHATGSTVQHGRHTQFAGLLDTMWLPVTTHAGRVITGFGRQLTHHDIDQMHDWVGALALAEVHNCWQITIADPQWGREDELWNILERFAASRGVPTVKETTP